MHGKDHEQVPSTRSEVTQPARRWSCASALYSTESRQRSYAAKRWQTIPPATKSNVAPAIGRVRTIPEGFCSDVNTDLPGSRISSKGPLEEREQIALQPEEMTQAAIEVGWWPHLRAYFNYMTCTEVHTYAFSVAANVILALFPFIVLMLTLAQRVFRSPVMVSLLGDLMQSLLPTSQKFVMRNMTILAHPHKGTQLFSVLMLLIASTGVFLPLEVALNNVWKVKQNRSYLHNQLVSLALATAVGVLVMSSVALTAAQRSLLEWSFFGHKNNFLFSLTADGVLRSCAMVASILMFFLIYWILPNRKIPVRSVLPAAVIIGLSWEAAKYIYVLALPRLDFESVYGPFRVSVGLMMWAFLSGLMLLSGAHFSAYRHAVRRAHEADRFENKER